MPTKLQRYTINTPHDLAGLLERDAAIFRRPVANHIVSIIAQYYEGLQKQADLFRDQSPKGRSEIPLIESPVDEPAKASRRSVGQEKT